MEFLSEICTLVFLAFAVSSEVELLFSYKRKRFLIEIFTKFRAFSLLSRSNVVSLTQLEKSREASSKTKVWILLYYRLGWIFYLLTLLVNSTV